MFGLSMSHMILLAAIALIVIGPKQLPEVARQLARFINELKRMTNDFSRSIVEARNTTDDHLRAQAANVHPEPSIMPIEPPPPVASAPSSAPMAVTMPTEMASTVGEQIE